MEKRDMTKGLDFSFAWGNKGLKVSLKFLLILLFLLFIFLYIRYDNLSEIGRIVFSPLNANDWLAVFAGGILFIIVPFLLGIRVGMSVKKRKINKKGVAIEGLVWWIVGIAVLIIMIVLAVVLRDKLGSIADFLKNLFRFRS